MHTQAIHISPVVTCSFRSHFIFVPNCTKRFMEYCVNIIVLTNFRDALTMTSRINRNSWRYYVTGLSVSVWQAELTFIPN